MCVQKSKMLCESVFTQIRIEMIRNVIKLKHNTLKVGAKILKQLFLSIILWTFFNLSKELIIIF